MTKRRQVVTCCQVVGPCNEIFARTHEAFSPVSRSMYDMVLQRSSLEIAKLVVNLIIPGHPNQVREQGIAFSSGSVP